MKIRSYEDLSEKKSCYTEDHRVHTENHGEISLNPLNQFDQRSHYLSFWVLCVFTVKISVNLRERKK